MSARLTFKTAPLSAIAGGMIAAAFFATQAPVADPGLVTLPAAVLRY